MDRVGEVNRKIMLKADRSVDSLYQKRAIRTIDVRSHEPEKAYARRWEKKCTWWWSLTPLRYLIRVLLTVILRVSPCAVCTEPREDIERKIATSEDCEESF